jgi:hypothetical protein
MGLPATGMPDATSLSPESQQQGGTQAEIEELMAMIQMLMAELQQQQQGGSQGGDSSNPADNIANDMGGGGGGGGAPSSGGGGVPSSGGGSSSPSGGSSGGAQPSNAPITAPNGSGEKALQIAQGQLGVQCQNIKVPTYNVDGRHTDGCADFVSAVESAAGRYHRTSGDPLVSNFEQDLKHQGWHYVSRGQAQPGDVAIFHNSSGGDQHTELVAKSGATQMIGNNGDSQETVGYDSGQWGAPVFLAPGNGG